MASTALFRPLSLCLHLYSGRQDACEHEGCRAWKLGIEYENQVAVCLPAQVLICCWIGGSFVSVNLSVVTYLSFVICAIKGGYLGVVVLLERGLLKTRAPSSQLLPRSSSPQTALLLGG